MTRRGEQRRSPLGGAKMVRASGLSRPLLQPYSKTPETTRASGDTEDAAKKAGWLSMSPQETAWRAWRAWASTYDISSRLFAYPVFVLYTTYMYYCACRLCEGTSLDGQRSVPMMNNHKIDRKITSHPIAHARYVGTAPGGVLSCSPCCISASVNLLSDRQNMRSAATAVRRYRPPGAAGVAVSAGA
ncbi:hypothetical protein GGR52DRAFT_553036 [Hypoxylon sp. FL1284]|nr:hypothetical protein GGR52DRAFT_553036 [Hypoxylon sp. FL1284]